MQKFEEAQARGGHQEGVVAQQRLQRQSGHARQPAQGNGGHKLDHGRRTAGPHLFKYVSSLVLSKLLL